MRNRMVNIVDSTINNTIAQTKILNRISSFQQRGELIFYAVGSTFQGDKEGFLLNQVSRLCIQNQVQWKQTPRYHWWESFQQKP